MNRQAIVTTYLCPTNHRQARIRAKAQAGSQSYPWDFELNTEDNHRRAAEQFAAHWGWVRGDFSDLHSGTLPNGDHCHVIDR